MCGARATAVGSVLHAERTEWRCRPYLRQRLPHFGHKRTIDIYTRSVHDVSHRTTACGAAVTGLLRMIVFPGRSRAEDDQIPP